MFDMEWRYLVFIWKCW